MISKAVPAHSFYHTCRYICRKQGAEILLAEGVRGHDFKLMAEDFIRQQQMRPSKQVACFHGILSFYPGERPSNEVMREIAKKYLQQLGLVGTQYAVCKHTDKAHLHLHIVANMVSNSGRTISDSYIGLRGKKIAQQLTQEYQLTPAKEKHLGLTHLENLSETEACRYQIYTAISQSLPHCLSMEELEKKLNAQGIEVQYKYKGQTGEKQGISFRVGDFCFKGSAVDRKFSLANLQKAFVVKQGQKLNPEFTTDVTVTGKHQREKRTSLFQQDIAKDPAKVQAMEAARVLSDLLRPEPSSDPIAFELLKENRQKGKKKSANRGQHL